MNNYSLDISSKVIVCFLDHYSMMKSDLLFVISNINYKIVKYGSKLPTNVNLQEIYMESFSGYQGVDTELLYLCANFQTDPG